MVAAPRLAAAQSALGVHATLCFPSPEPEVAERFRRSCALVPALAGVGRAELSLPGGMLGRMVQRSWREKLGAALAQADLVHLHGQGSTIVELAATLAAAETRVGAGGVPIFFSPYAAPPPKHPGKAWTAARLVLATGPAQLDAIRMGGFTSQILPAGVFLEEIGSWPPPGSFLDAYPALHQSPYVLCPSPLSPAWGQDLLIQAFGAIAGRHLETNLVLAGTDLGDAPRLRQLIIHLGLLQRTVLLDAPRGPERLAAINDATLVCLPWRAPGEMAVGGGAEAMLASKPLVVCAAADIAELADRGAGVVVEPQVPDLAAALDRVLRDPPLTAEMGKRARILAMERFTWPQIARESLLLARDVLK